MNKCGTQTITKLYLYSSLRCISFFTLNTGYVQSAPIDIYPRLRTYLLSGQFTDPFTMIVRVQRSRKLKTS